MRPHPHLSNLAVTSLVLALCLTAPSVSGATPQSLDTVGDVGEASSLALDATGNPVISYRDTTNQDLKVLHCNDPNCVGGDESITSPDTAGFVGAYTSLALDALGNPVISYLDNTNLDLKVMHCNDPDCAGGDESIVSPDTVDNVGYYTSLALDASGNPVVSYYDQTNGDLKLLHCDDPDCAPGGNTVERVDVIGDVGTHTSLALDGTGRPVISYHDVTNGDLKVVHCDIASCADGQISYSLDTTGTVGTYTSLVLDDSGNPVVSYYDATNGDLKLLHCYDPACSSGGTVERVDLSGTVGLWTSLALDGSGYPVISYLDATNSALKVVHCDIASCADGQLSLVVDDVGDVGSWSSLVLDASGNPVISYYDATLDPDGDLKLVHCDNPTCATPPPVVDADGDGIPDDLDSDGGSGSLAPGFVDTSTAVPTTGTVLSGTVTVVDAADPAEGVRVTAGPGGAVLSPVCGSPASVEIAPGASATITCHSVEIGDVSVGPVTVTLPGGAVVTFPDGTSGTVDTTPAGGAVVTGVSGDGVTLSVGAVTTPVPEGDTLNLVVDTSDSNTVYGTPGDDLILGLGGNDTIYGGDGDDTIVAEAGNNTIYGGDGNDTIVAGAGNDAIEGGAGDDTIDAGSGNNVVFGGPDNDQLSADAGNDKLDGGDGVDTCQAGSGNNKLKRCES